MGHFIDAFRQYADFKGRARRKQFWMFYLFYVIFYVILGVIDFMLASFILSSIFVLASLIPFISITARRLHDTGRSGWWQLIALVPVIGAIVLIVFLAQDSRDENQYGQNPKLVAV